MLKLPECPKDHYIAVQVSSDDVRCFLEDVYDMGYKWAGGEPDNIEALMDKQNLISLEDDRLYYSPDSWYFQHRTPQYNNGQGALFGLKKCGYIFVCYDDLKNDEISFDDIDQILSTKEECG